MTMQEEISRDIEIRPSSVALWTGALSGPIATAIHLELRLALLPWACHKGFRWALSAIAIPMLLICATGFFLAWRERSQQSTRVRFMAVGGMMLSAICFLTVIALTIPDFFFRPCD